MNQEHTESSALNLFDGIAVSVLCIVAAFAIQAAGLLAGIVSAIQEVLGKVSGIANLGGGLIKLLPGIGSLANMADSAVGRAGSIVGSFTLYVTCLVGLSAVLVGTALFMLRVQRHFSPSRLIFLAIPGIAWVDGIRHVLAGHFESLPAVLMVAYPLLFVVAAKMAPIESDEGWGKVFVITAWIYTILFPVLFVWLLVTQFSIAIGPLPIILLLAGPAYVGSRLVGGDPSKLLSEAGTLAESQAPEMTSRFSAAWQAFQKRD